MSQPNPAHKIRDPETEIAVLQVQYSNLTEKVDDVKTGLKDLQSSLDIHMTEIRQSMNNIKTEFNSTISKFKEENTEEHEKVQNKIGALEKWRWMIMGAGVLAGASGFPALQKLLGM